MDLIPNYIPLFVIPETENSNVIECETSEQRTVRIMREDKINHIKSEIEKLEHELYNKNTLKGYKMTKGREHDILKYVGTPLMIVGGVVYYKTDNVKAGMVACIGATMQLSWAAVDILKYLNDRHDN